MTLVRRANSKHWYVQFQLKHQTIIRSTRTTDKRTAERVAAKIRAEAHERIVLGKKKQTTLGEALERFVQSKAGTPNHRNQLIHAKQILRHIRPNLPLAALQPSMLEEYRQRRVEAGMSSWPDRHSVPDAVRDYCMFAVPSSAGSGAMVTGAGGRYPRAE